MKKLTLLMAVLIQAIIVKSQVYVNNVDLNTTVKTFELHMAVKPFTSKQCLYIDYGQNFKEQNYDVTQSQWIEDSARVKFKKGEYFRLHNYLDANGWVEDSKRESKLGDVPVSIVLYKRK